jgi:FKBP-type peptidyl-prolyl cis-trans isomerase
MKSVKLIIPVLAAVIMLAPSCKNQSSGKLKNDIDSISYCYGLSIGKSIKMAEMPDFNMAVFEQACNDAMKDKKALMTEEQVNTFARSYFMALQMRNAAKNTEKNTKFFEENKKRSTVKVTASGLQYEVIKDGTGAVPTKEDNVTVQYKGTLLDGTVFDSSYDRGQPASFPVAGVIPGWTEALMLMKVGAKYKIYIPAELAYGMEGRGEKIKPNSALIFEMELLSVDAKTATPGGSAKK